MSERESFRHETSPSVRWKTKRRGSRTRMKTEGGEKDFETMEDLRERTSTEKFRILRFIEISREWQSDRVTKTNRG